MGQRTVYGTAGDKVHTFRGRAWSDPLFSPPSLIDQVRGSVSAHRGLLAVSEVTAGGQLVRALTYQQLWAEVEAKAQLVPRNCAGIDKTVAVLADNSIDSLTTSLGIVLAGAAAVVIDASEPIARRSEMVRALGAPLVTSGCDIIEVATVGEKLRLLRSSVIHHGLPQSWCLPPDLQPRRRPLRKAVMPSRSTRMRSGGASGSRPGSR